jgi:peptide subunit release factor 1 (eRF1)
VLERAGAVIEEDRARREREAVGRVMEGLGTGSKSVAGPDEVLAALEDRRVATLLVSKGAAGGRFEQAARLLRCEHEVAIVSGATHLFEEPGALERVAELAAEWFSRYLPASPD